jgi:hypothetical protein
LTTPTTVEGFLNLPVAVRVVDAHGLVTVVKVDPDGRAYVHERVLAETDPPRPSSGMTDLDNLDVDGTGRRQQGLCASVRLDRDPSLSRPRVGFACWAPALRRSAQANRADIDRLGDAWATTATVAGVTTHRPKADVTGE